MLAGKQVVVFGATGAVGEAVVGEALRQGARVWASGRRHEAVEALAERWAGKGDLRVAVVDARDPDQVGAHLDAVSAEGRLDAVFNAIGDRPALLFYPRRTVEVSVEEFLRSSEVILGSQFLTAQQAGRRMAAQGGGALILLSATLSVMTAPNMAGLSAANGAIEALTRALAGDFSPAGVRVNCVRASAMPETRTIQETFAGQMALGAGGPMPLPPLGRPITLQDTAGAVAFLAGPGSSGMTGQVVTVCAGAFV